MIQLVKSIVNGNRSLIGFVIKGTEKEMGGLSSKTLVERAVPIDSIIKDKFANNQICVVNNKLVQKQGFKISSLPMCVYTEDNTYIDVSNAMTITARFVKNNENVGFRIKFDDGTEGTFVYANIIKLCSWFKPSNFTIRTSSKGKTYICGKKGGPNLTDFPAVTIGDEPKDKPKKMKSAAKDIKPEINGVLESGYDVLDIYEFIKTCGGCVIKLPEENYKAATEGGETVTEGFTSLGIGEVASATPMFNATKINVNAGFKKVGVVPVNINGQNTNLTSFVYRTKSLFLNGDNYIKKFGIAVPTNREEELLRLLGGSLAFEKITDASVIQPLSQVIDAKSLSFYKVDSSKIDLISEKKREVSVLSTKQLVSLCKKQYELKLLSKFLSPRTGLIKEIKQELGDTEFAEVANKKLFGLFAMMNNEGLAAITEAGIDIYSGAYVTPSKQVVKKTATGVDAITAEDVEVEYVLKGFDASKITGKQIKESVTNEMLNSVASELPADVVKYVKKILSITDLKKRYAAANEVNSTVNKKLEEINVKLWMHNASMYITGNKSRVHTHDNKMWVPDVTSRAKKCLVYVYKGKGIEGLTIKCSGVEI